MSAKVSFEPSHPWRDEGSARTLPPTFLFLQYSIFKEQTPQTRCRGPVRFWLRARSSVAHAALLISFHKGELSCRQRRAALVGEAYIVGGPSNCQHRFRTFLNFLRRPDSQPFGRWRQRCRKVSAVALLSARATMAALLPPQLRPENQRAPPSGAALPERIGPDGAMASGEGRATARRSLTSPAATGNCRGHKNESRSGHGEEAAVLNARYRRNHSRTRQRAAADCRWAQRPARPARGFGALAFRHLPDRRHLERADGRGAVCRARRPRAARDPAEIAEADRGMHDDGEVRRGAPRPTRLVAAAPDRQRQGPPAHGSVDGDQGRRPRRHPHHALRADQDGACRRPQDDPQLSALRSARRLRRGRRRQPTAAPRPA